MKRRLTQWLRQGEAPVPVGTYWTRTTPARGAERVVLAVLAPGNTGGGSTLQVFAGATEEQRLDGAGGDTANEDTTQGAFGISNAFSSAVVPNNAGAWQYVTVYSNGAAAGIASEYIRFRYVIAVASMQGLFMRLITVFSFPGPDEDATGKRTDPL